MDPHCGRGLFCLTDDDRDPCCCYLGNCPRRWIIAPTSEGCDEDKSGPSVNLASATGEREETAALISGPGVVGCDAVRVRCVMRWHDHVPSQMNTMQIVWLIKNCSVFGLLSSSLVKLCITSVCGHGHTFDGSAASTVNFKSHVQWQLDDHTHQTHVSQLSVLSFSGAKYTFSSLQLGDDFPYSTQMAWKAVFSGQATFVHSSVLDTCRQ